MARSEGPVPLGPGSLTWRYFGDWRGLLIALWAGSMQNMHPGLGAGVEQHSGFFRERWQRLFRSLYPIGGVVYDGPRAERTAREVRGYHDQIKGVDSRGRRYHALDPDTFYWAHATFFVSTILIGDRFCGGVTERQKRQLFDEHVLWYRLYGMSTRPVPGSWEEFRQYWDHVCREVLEVNQATRDVLDLSDLDRPAALPWLPRPLWRLLRVPLARGFRWLTVGLYDPVIRERLGFTWTCRDEQLLRLFGRVLNAAFTLVPHDWRFHPRARAGWRRAAGKSGGTPVETPARNLPPPDERDDPKHYSPRLSVVE